MPPRNELKRLSLASSSSGKAVVRTTSHSETNRKAWRIPSRPPVVSFRLPSKDWKRPEGLWAGWTNYRKEDSGKLSFPDYTNCSLGLPRSKANYPRKAWPSSSGLSNATSGSFRLI